MDLLKIKLFCSEHEHHFDTQFDTLSLIKFSLVWYYVRGHVPYILCTESALIEQQEVNK